MVHNLEFTGTLILMVFLKKKKMIQDKWVISGQKVMCGFTLRAFVKFCTMKGTKRSIEIKLTVFFLKKRITTLNLVRFCFKILHNESRQEV